MGRTAITARQIIDAPARRVFDLLADPRRHPEIDGSDMVRGDDDAVPITGVGQVFRMKVHHVTAGDYGTDNHVTRFERPSVIAWMTSALDQPPAGWEWIWRLDPLQDERTEVSVTCDWSQVHDAAVLRRIGFPGVPLEALQQTLERLDEIITP